MIRSFRCKDTQALFAGGHLKRFRAIETVATRKLAMLDAAKTLDFSVRRRAIGLWRARVIRQGNGACASTISGGVLRVDQSRSGRGRDRRLLL